MRNKIVRWLLALALCAPLCACAGESGRPGGLPAGAVEWPVYADDETVFLSAYMNPWLNTDEQYDWVKESGLNHMYISYSSNVETMRGALEQCERIGVKTIPMTCWGRPVGDGYPEKSFDAYPVDMSDYPGFVGFNILDEPFYEDFDYLADEYKKYKTAYPDKVFYTNLLRPNVGKNSLSDAKNVTYDTYIDDFIDKVMRPITGKKVMSMTLYPLLSDEVTKEKSVQDTHLIDLGKFAVKTKEAGADMYHFVQAISFGGTHHLPSEADIRFQIYCGMAFGTKGFQYFTYATPNVNYEFSASDYGMINRNNKRTSVYYGVQAVNAEITKFDHVFLKFDFESAMLADGELAETENPGFALYRSNDEYPLVESTDALKSAACSRDTLIGVLRDGDGRDGYTVVNYTHPSYNLTDTIRLDFSGARGLLVYRGGEEMRLTRDDPAFANGIYTADLEPGEGLFVIPVA